MADLFGYRGADVSECGRYRYRLWRRWGDGPVLTFVMLNPSIADGLLDDPTIRRCVSFAARDGFEGIEVVNLFAQRATVPDVLVDVNDPVGPRNLEVVADVLDVADAVVVAWGAVALEVIGERRRRGGEFDPRLTFRDRLRGGDGPAIECLGLTKDGHPRHPLYVKGDAPRRPWTGAEVAA